MRKLILLLSAFIAVNGYSTDLQSTRFFDNNAGLIDHLSPLRLPNNAATVINNITMDDRGTLSKRNGYTVIQSTSVLGPASWPVVGGAYHTAATGTSFFSVVVGTDIFRIPSDFSSYTKVTGAVSLTNSYTNQVQTTDLQDKVVYCNNSDKPFYLGSSGNATTISTNTFSAGKTCATYGSYLVVANTTESSTAFPSRVRWSDVNDINSFPALNYIDVEPDNGDAIVGIIAFDEAVYIFKHRSIYVMRITGLDGPDAFIIRPISRNIGAWAKNSIKVIPSVGIAFLAQNTAYLLNDSGLTPIGDSIQRTFDTVQRSQWQYAVAAVYPHRYQYWLAVSTASTTNNTVLVYDYVQKNWTTFSGMSISMLTQSEDTTGQNILVSGDYGATTYKQDNGSTDNPDGTSTAISAIYTTPDLAMGDLHDITKGYKYLYVFTQGDQNYTLNVKAAYDYVSTFEFNQDISIGSSGAVYDTGIYDTDIYPASGNAVTRIELNRSARSIKLQFSNSSSGQVFGLIGWTVVYSNEDYKQ